MASPTPEATAGAAAAAVPPPDAAPVTAAAAEAKRNERLEDLQRKRKRAKLLRRATPLLLTLPWFLGLIWTALHPLVSVITGELKCRGQYIDENGLDVHRHRVAVYPLERTAANTSNKANRAKKVHTAADGEYRGMCHALHSGRVSIAPSVECLRHQATESVAFDVAKILPAMGPVVESTEAVAIVVGTSGGYDKDAAGQEGDWYEDSDLNASIMHLIQKLGRREDCPWLSKAVYVVSPAHGTTVTSENATSVRGEGVPLGATVDAFVASYSGDRGVRPLPPHFTFPIVRSVLVLNDVGMTSNEPSDGRTTEVRILPHGERGSLPNLDLVFATFLSFQSRPAGDGHDPRRSLFHGGAEFRAHPFGSAWEERIGGMLGRLGDALGANSAQTRQYAKDLAGWIGFVAGLVVGPRPPHASALNHGIDALTVEVRVPSDGGGSSSSSIHPHYVDLVRCTEHLLRSISNLHERLHHSIAQYTMPSPAKFVSHGEYIYPAILVTLPMVVRAASLALRDLRLFQFLYVGVVMGSVCVATAIVGIWASITNEGRKRAGGASEWLAHVVFFTSYLLVVLATRRSIAMPGKASNRDEKADQAQSSDADECRGSLRFVACLVGIYLHAPLLLANYSLGFPSSVFWTPLLATLVPPPRLRALFSRNVMLAAVSMAVKVMFLVATSPPVLLVPRIFHWYTPYVLCVYTPLHLLLTALWLA